MRWGASPWLTLVTRNADAFRFFEGLRVENWFAGRKIAGQTSPRESFKKWIRPLPPGWALIQRGMGDQ